MKIYQNIFSSLALFLYTLSNQKNIELIFLVTLLASWHAIVGRECPFAVYTDTGS
jgi:hypothetical protein